MKSLALLFKQKFKTFEFVKQFIKTYGYGSEQRQIIYDYLKAHTFGECDDATCLQLCLQWLCTAQDVCEGNGVAAAYYLGKGWDVAYPETSGYIIATYLAYSKLYNDNSFADRAIQIGSWEIDIQASGGGVLSNPRTSFTRIFNTGQVILGWSLLYEKTEQTKYLDAALKAGDYILRQQESNGTWVKDTYCGARTYHARVDWALLRLTQLSNDPKYAAAALRNLLWVLKQQNPNGWFNNCGFDNHQPITHVIAYTLRGLLECHDLGVRQITELDILPRIQKAVDPLCNVAVTGPVNHIPGMIPTSFDRNWNSHDNHSCLTGNAQFACLLYRLYQITGQHNYAKIADTVLSAVKLTQIKQCSFTELTGAIAGSYPVYMGYMNHAYPNWAAKFFADGLMLKNHDKTKLAIAA